MQLKDKAPG